MLELDLAQLGDRGHALLQLDGLEIANRPLEAWKKASGDRRILNLSTSFCRRPLLAAVQAYIASEGEGFFSRAHSLIFLAKQDQEENYHRIDELELNGEDLLHYLDVVVSQENPGKILSGEYEKRNFDENRVRTIAFYLPQFYPFPENERWWGSGFTEWSNVIDALPQHADHRMPLTPADLGFYDLRVEETRKKQGDLAAEYGIDGFCYYYYWFSGQRLMQHVLDEILSSGQPSTDFCLCWANESWSRRWDGSEDEVDLLVKQDHNPEIDKSIIDDLLPFFKDDRYIKINGCPLILIYRLDIMNDADATITAWRAAAIKAGFDGLFVAAVRSFGLQDEAASSVDAIVDFPPHTAVANEVTSKIQVRENFQGKIFDYRQVVVEAAGRKLGKKLTFPGVMPRWDNTPRKGSKSHIFTNSTPEAFKVWLRFSLEQAQQLPAGKKMLFINSWNEWGEGAMLEPDRVFGRSYLEAVRSVRGDYVVGPSDAAKFALVSSLAPKGAAEQLANFSREVQMVAQIMAKERASRPINLKRGLPEILRELNTAPILDGGCLIIDNSAPKKTENIVRFGPDESWEFGGWVMMRPHEEHSFERIAYLVLSSESDPRVYFHAAVYSWLQRVDVAEYHAFDLKPASCYYGYNLHLNMSSMIPGRYSVQMIQLINGQLYSAPSFTSVSRG